MKTRNKSIKLSTRFLVVSILFFLISLNMVNAEVWACLRFGQEIPFSTCLKECCVHCLDDEGYSVLQNRCSGLTRCTCGGTQDVDGDGYDYFTDCDDSDPLTYPGAPEYCDGEDRNCDGTPSSTRIHEADYDCDEQLEFYELHDYIGLWKIDQKTMQDILSAISVWNGIL